MGGQRCTMLVLEATCQSFVFWSKGMHASTLRTKRVTLLSVRYSLLSFYGAMFVIDILDISLVNAASKGHMSIVEYLLEEANANPLIKNNFQEAAYDVSAASGEAGEAYICEMLEKAGTNWWPVLQMEGWYKSHIYALYVLLKRV